MINNQVFTVQGEAQYSAYITYSQQTEAAQAILALQEFPYEQTVLKAHFGTSKYCSLFLKSQVCTNPSCVFQHASAPAADTLSTADMANPSRLNSLHKQMANSILKDVTIHENPNGFPTVKTTLQHTPLKLRKKLINILE